jgi:hypothetical protein
VPPQWPGTRLCWLLRPGIRTTGPAQESSFASHEARVARHEVAFGLFGLFCTKQTLVLLLLEFRFGHRICSRIGRRCTFARYSNCRRYSVRALIQSNRRGLL